MSAGNTLIGIGVNNVRRLETDNDALNNYLFGADIEVASPAAMSQEEHQADEVGTQHVHPIKKHTTDNPVETFNEITKIIKAKMLEDDAAKIRLIDEIETRTRQKIAKQAATTSAEKKLSQLQATLSANTISLDAQLNEYTERFSGLIELAHRIENKDTPLLDKTDVFINNIAEMAVSLAAMTEEDENGTSVLHQILIDITMTRAEIARIQSEIAAAKEKIDDNTAAVASLDTEIDSLQKSLMKLEADIEKSQKRLKKAGAYTLSALDTPRKSLWRRR